MLVGRELAALLLISLCFPPCTHDWILPHQPVGHHGPLPLHVHLPPLLQLVATQLGQQILTTFTGVDTEGLAGAFHPKTKVGYTNFLSRIYNYQRKH